VVVVVGGKGDAFPEREIGLRTRLWELWEPWDGRRMRPVGYGLTGLDMLVIFGPIGLLSKGCSFKRATSNMVLQMGIFRVFFLLVFLCKRPFLSAIVSTHSAFSGDPKFEWLSPFQWVYPDSV
jgi:hypothetical protein